MEYQLRLQKHHPSSFLPSPPLKSANCPRFPFWAKPPILVFCDSPSLKIGFFSEPQKYNSFSSLNPCQFLKVTKFLVKTSQFEFLVMAQKNIFVYLLFSSLNLSKIQFIFYVQIATSCPSQRSSPSFPTTPLFLIEVLSSPLFENLVGGSTPLPPSRLPPKAEREGVHTMNTPCEKQNVDGNAELSGAKVCVCVCVFFSIFFSQL